MPYLNKAWLHLLRLRGLVSKGRYGQYQYRDPDFSRLGKNIFLMLGLSHSGSAQLNELFDSNASIYTCKDILNPASCFTFYDFLDRCAAVGIRTSTPDARRRLFKWYLFEETRKHSQPVTVFDISLESGHILTDNLEESCWACEICEMARFANMGVIFLYRNHLLERHVSSLQAGMAGNAVGYAASNIKITVPVDGLVERFRHITYIRKRILEQFHHYPAFMEVIYEELFEPVEAGTERQFRTKLVEDLASLMGISTSFDTTSTSHNLDSGELADQIENYDEIKQVLKQPPVG